VKRGLPRSHLHRAAPSFSVPGPSSSDEGSARAARRHAGEHEAKVSEREHPRCVTARSAREFAAPGNDESRVFELRRFGVQKSAGRTFVRGRRERFARGTRGLARRNERSRGDCAERSKTRANGCGSCDAPLQGVVIQLAFMRASLIGIASGGVRARRLGKSQGRERMTKRSMEGCLGLWIRSSKQGARLQPWLRRFSRSDA
jgi:hypothetical protein